MPLYNFTLTNYRVLTFIKMLQTATAPPSVHLAPSKCAANCQLPAASCQSRPANAVDVGYAGRKIVGNYEQHREAAKRCCNVNVVEQQLCWSRGRTTTSIRTSKYLTTQRQLTCACRNRMVICVLSRNTQIINQTC